MSNKLAVIYGGPSPEHDISILTGLQAAKILSSKYEVLNIYWSRDNRWFLVDNDLESKDFIENTNIFKKEITIKYDSNPGFYIKKKKIEIITINTKYLISLIITFSQELKLQQCPSQI